MGEATSTTLAWLEKSFGWLFVLTTAAFVLFSGYLALSRYGNIKLGPDDAEPEFSTFSWVSMMFATGMGIGLIFWGVAEPLTHLNTPPMGMAEPGSPDAARLAMEYTFFHWGLHPWSIYAVIGLAIAYFAYRKGYGNLISATFRPLIGDAAGRAPGKAIDVVAIFATLFGSATSLGLGALQITGGLDNVFDGSGKSVGLALLRDLDPDRLLRASRRSPGSRRACSSCPTPTRSPRSSWCSSCSWSARPSSSSARSPRGWAPT